MYLAQKYSCVVIQAMEGFSHLQVDGSTFIQDHEYWSSPEVNSLTFRPAVKRCTDWTTLFAFGVWLALMNKDQEIIPWLKI